jgi:tripartite-type tricarboxylate transporter receptor subunit TctC
VQGVASATIGIAGFKNDPRIRLLAYTGEHRSKFLPELPTVAESGVPGFKFDSWFGVLGPATMPKAEVDKLNAALNKVLSDPVVQERLTKLGVEPGTLSVADFNKLLAADWETSGALVKASGARIE